MPDDVLLAQLVDHVGTIRGDIGEIKGDLKLVNGKLDDVTAQTKTNTEDIACLKKYKNYGIGAVVAVSTVFNVALSHFKDIFK